MIFALAFVVVAEVAHRRASRMHNRPRPRAGETTAIVVLGYGSRGKPVHPVQRWRTSIGARTLDRVGRGTLIFSGSADRQRSGRPEAEVMAEYAVEALGVPQSCVVLELESSNTWDNVRLALPLAAESEWIAFASDPLHARRAARYVALQFPELASRVVGADDYRPFEKLGLKAATGLYEAFVAVRDWQFRRRDRRGRR